MKESGEGLLVDDDEDLFDDVLVELDEFEHVDDEDKSSCPCCCCWPRRSSDDELDDPPLLFLLDLVDLLAEDFFERSFEASFDGVLTSGGPAGCDDDDSLSPPPFEFFFSSSSSMSSPTSPAATAATVDSTDELQLLLTAAPSEPVLLLVPPLGVPFEFAVVVDDALLFDWESFSSPVGPVVVGAAAPPFFLLFTVSLGFLAAFALGVFLLGLDLLLESSAPPAISWLICRLSSDDELVPLVPLTGVDCCCCCCWFFFLAEADFSPLGFLALEPLPPFPPPGGLLGPFDIFMGVEMADGSVLCG